MLSADDVWPILERIGSESGGPTANRVKSCLAAAFNRAIGERWRDLIGSRTTSPTVGLKQWKESARKRFFSRDEIPVLWREGPKVNEALGDIIKLMLLTGCRRNEIARASEREINLDEARLELPGERTKNTLEHWVPLSEPALVILKRNMPGKFGDGRLFPKMSEDDVKHDLDELLQQRAEQHRVKNGLEQPVLFQPLVRADLNGKLEHWVVEDTRRTCSTGWREWLRLPGGKIPEDRVIDLLLNHIRGAKAGHRGTYNRAQLLDERSLVLQAWGDFIVRLVGEGEPAKVVKIHA
jgi:integrase